MKKMMLILCLYGLSAAAQAKGVKMSKVKSAITQAFEGQLQRQLGAVRQQVAQSKEQYKLQKIMDKEIAEQNKNIQSYLSGSFDLTRVLSYEENKKHNRWMPDSWNDAIRDADIEKYGPHHFSYKNIGKSYMVANAASDDALQFNVNHRKNQTRYKEAISGDGSSKSLTDTLNEGVYLIQDQQAESIWVDAAILRAMALERQLEQQNFEEAKRFITG